MKEIRVRFAPSPTGIMHLGNVRSALMNFLYARKYNGNFILRIEDTDFKRNIENLALKIMDDLYWLGLSYDEGPIKDGKYGPYYQSQRTEIYKKYLDKLITENKVYRCFCLPTELEEKRQKQLSLGLPPKYDRTCLNLSEEKIREKLKIDTKFIWRFKLDENKTVSFFDLAHKNMTFELKHFSDIPITRQDGSFNFIFANFVDDHAMKISHVFRGEDHLSNTALQVALYQAFNFDVPIFWHLPIISNLDGKKLSKRDFGFSLNDLKDNGYLPEAICNYLTIIGGSFKDEIMDMNQLVNSIDFENLSSTGLIKYDLQKLNWVNHQWIIRYDLDKLTNLAKDFIIKDYPEVANIDYFKLKRIIEILRSELINLKDLLNLLEFYFQDPDINIDFIKNQNLLENQNDIKFFIEFIKYIENNIDVKNNLVDLLRNKIKENKRNISDIFKLLRYALTGKIHGLNIAELFEILDKKKIINRLNNLINIFKNY